MQNEELRNAENEINTEDTEVAADEAKKADTRSEEASAPEVDSKDSSAPTTKSRTDKKKTVVTYLHDLVYLLAVVLVIFLFFLRVVVVSGPSMDETLNDGDYLLLLNSVFFKDYKQGDIIVASKDSFHDGEPIIKRVIATEGQTVDIDFNLGIVYVDGKPLDESYINTPTNLDEGTEFPLVVGEGKLFVLGDNRNHSKDSRSPEIGLIDKREVLGKAVFLIFPGLESGKRHFDRIGVIQ